MTNNPTSSRPAKQPIAIEALSLSHSGWSVIPLKPKSKEPLIPWRELQRRRLTEREIIEIFERHPDANVGVITGKVSQLLVLDADSPSVVKRLGSPLTPIAETSRGRHYYFQLPDARIRSITHIADGLDLRAEGGYVVTPPSLHPTGKRYEWVIPPKGLDPLGPEPAPPPAWLLELISKRRAHSRPVREIIYGVHEGERNVSATALAGKLLGCLPTEDWWVAWELLKSWNAQNKPPLPERELRQVFDSIARRELQKRTLVENEQHRFFKNLVQFIQKNFSQRELALALNVTQPTVSRRLKSLPYLVSASVLMQKSAMVREFCLQSDARSVGSAAPKK